MKNIKMISVLAAFGLAVASHAGVAIDWAGGTGQWTNGVNWVGGIVPDILNGVNDAVISSGTAVYDPAGGDFQADIGSRIILDGGTLEQNSTAWMKFFNSGGFEISNGGSLQTGANVVQMVFGACSVDGASSSLAVTGIGKVSLEDFSTLALSGGATAELSTLEVTLWNGSQFNLSDTSVANLKNIWIEAPIGDPSRVNLSDAARLNLNGADENVIRITAGGDSFLNFEAGYTGYVNIKGIEESVLDTMIADGKFGISGTAVTNPASYAVTTNINVVNIGLVAPPIPDPYLSGLWVGESGNWFDTVNWSGGVVPDINGVDDVIISSPTNILVTYVPGPDFVFNLGSDLLLDSSTLYQDSTAWSAFYRGSEFTIKNGGAWLFEQTHMLIFGYDTGEAVHTIDNSSFAVRELEVDDQQVIVVTNGATATVSVYADVSNGSRFEVTDATLNIGEVNLYEFEGVDGMINVNDGGQVNLDAAFQEEGFKTNVITTTGGSMINFLSESTSGKVFIDNISRADVETLISQGKFGQAGSVDTVVANYTIIAEGLGQSIRVVPMPIGPLDINASGGDIILSWTSFDGQIYEVQSKADLTDPSWGVWTNVFGIGGYMSITNEAGSTESFYQVISE